MFDLRELYQEVILDHSKSPRNYGRPANANCQARGDNPLCGDRMTVYLNVQDGVVKEIAFEGSGCAISMASASLMTEAVRGKTEVEARGLFKRFHSLVTEAEPADADDTGALDKLTVFAGVREFPIRVKCATLPWHTFTGALDRRADMISTE